MFHLSIPPHYFNPRSHEGSDIRSRSIWISHRYFNPRSHEGSDFGKPIELAKRAISIHAPTKGATKNIAMLPMLQGFQSTLPRRERLSESVILCAEHIFQSTLPRRERRTKSEKQHLMLNFNPRSHEGSDLTLESKGKKFTISIHAPTKGATEASFPREKTNKYFNPRSHEGSDTKL